MSVKSSHSANVSFLAALLLSSVPLLSACGGGGGDGGSPTPTNTGADCSSLGQRQFVRQMVDDKYLFYRYAGTTLPSAYTGEAPQYFTDITRNAIPSLDRFSFVMTTAQANASFQEGTDVGLGVSGRYDANNNVRITFVEPASPAARAGLMRGDQLVAINGTAIPSTGVTQAQNNALFTSTAGTVVSLDYIRKPDPATYRVTLTATQFTTNPVPLAKTFTANGRKTSYLVFNDHNLPSETQLADAFRQFAQAGTQDLVLDLRYNGGGYTAIASQVAYMIAGAQTQNKVFDYIAFNDKHSAQNAYEPFYNTIGLGTTRRGEALATLNLARVYVLTSPQTCSASELIINGLRGIDVNVTTIGGSTCGKPYGMQQADYCGYSYFPLQFKFANQKGTTDYTSGFAPTCQAGDDVEHALGDPNEGMLSSALSYQAGGVCAVSTTKAAGAREGALSGLTLSKLRQSAIVTQMH